MELKTMLSVAFIFIMLVMCGGLVYAAANHDGSCASATAVGGVVVLAFIGAVRSEIES